jgi:hypothetical protein
MAQPATFDGGTIILGSAVTVTDWHHLRVAIYFLLST